MLLHDIISDAHVAQAILFPMVVCFTPVIITVSALCRPIYGLFSLFYLFLYLSHKIKFHIVLVTCARGM